MGEDGKRRRSKETARTSFRRLRKTPAGAFLTIIDDCGAGSHEGVLRNYASPGKARSPSTGWLRNQESARPIVHKALHENQGSVAFHREEHRQRNVVQQNSQRQGKPQLTRKSNQDGLCHSQNVVEQTVEGEPPAYTIMVYMLGLGPRRITMHTKLPTAEFRGSLAHGFHISHQQRSMTRMDRTM